MIKATHVLIKCALSGQIKEIGENWATYRWVRSTLMQCSQAFCIPINSSTYSSANSQLSNSFTYAVYLTKRVNLALLSEKS